jgi:hypothetical protein
LLRKLNKFQGGTLSLKFGHPVENPRLALARDAATIFCHISVGLGNDIGVAIEILPLSQALGAEITGIDLRQASRRTRSTRSVKPGCGTT